MKYDLSLFYDTILPVPNNGSLPRIRAEMWCEEYYPQLSNCPSSFNINFADTIPQYCICQRVTVDSFVFQGDTSFDISALFISAYKFTEWKWVGINEKKENIIVQLSPNPFLDEIIIVSTEPIISYEILNYTGQIKVRKDNLFLKEFPIPAHGFISGFYFIKLKTADKIITQKIIKIQ